VKLSTPLNARFGRYEKEPSDFSCRTPWSGFVWEKIDAPLRTSPASTYFAPGRPATVTARRRLGNAFTLVCASFVATEPSYRKVRVMALAPLSAHLGCYLAAWSFAPGVPNDRVRAELLGHPGLVSLRVASVPAEAFDGASNYSVQEFGVDRFS
jgi:hypothetical protein